jgi:tetraacyldisaccharide 4'-kinase
VQQRLTQLWYSEQAPPGLLRPLAAGYGGLLRLRTYLYTSGLARRRQAGKPVVVVGNLTVGGTGKTPFTIWLAQELRRQGLRPGIISRGYGRRGGAVRLVSAAADWHEVGDEPLLLARHAGAPTAVGARRLAAARLLAPEVDALIADDGLQHLALARDCEIVVVDGARGFGNGRLLPAGPLREPLTRLASADAVIVNGAPRHASLAQLPASDVYRMTLAMQETVPLSGAAPRRALSTWRGARVHAVAGIGNPARFFEQLRAHGLEVIEHAFADHHALQPGELAFGDQLAVLMTEKDAVKYPERADPRLWYVPVSAQFAAGDAAALLALVLARIGNPPTPPGDAR